MPLEIRVDVLASESKSIAYAKGRQVTAAEDPSDCPTRDLQVRGELGLSEKAIRPLVFVAWRCMTVAHGDNVQTPSEAVGTPDQTRSEAQLRLERFAVEWFGDRFPEIGRGLGIAPLEIGDGLREAAKAVIEEVQLALGALRDRIGDEPLEASLGNRLGTDRYHAVLALVELEPSQKHAKQALLRLTGGEPLTICTGDAFRIDLATRGVENQRVLSTPFVADPVRFSVQGCYRIFPDVVTTVGHMWPTFCPGCNNVARQPARDQRRALARRIQRMVRQPTIYETTGLPPKTRLLGTDD